ncbi:Ionotropic receptor 241, partial [Frankliniella occidentalis]
QRPLLASWLAVSVVLAAAYQGQVLSRLTVPDAADEINSMEELAASGLTVYLRSDFSQLVLPLLKTATLHNNDLLEFVVHTLLKRRERVAIVILDNMAKYLLQHTRGPGRLLHMFPVPGVRILRSLFSTVKGSPVQRPLKTLMGRLRAGGIVDLLQRYIIPRKSQYAAPAAPLRALALADVVPPFLALAVGLSLATIVFLCEVARARLV